LPGSLVFLAPSAVVVGDVTVRSGASAWHNAVLRGDLDAIVIGHDTSIQDNATVHVDDGLPARVGDRVTVGHGAVLHACRVGDGCLIGMNATVLSGAEVGEGCIIAAGSVVPENAVLPPGSIYGGVPARKIGDMTENHRRRIALSSAVYKELAAKSLPPAEDLHATPELRVRVAHTEEFRRLLERT